MSDKEPENEATNLIADDATKPIIGEILPKNDVDKNHPMQVVLNYFLRAMDDYRDAVNSALPALARARHDRIDKLIAKFDSYESTQLEDGTTEFSSENTHEIKEIIENIRELDRLKESRVVRSVARSLFIGIFSAFDGYMGSLLKAIYLQKPNLFKGIKKEISLCDLLEFGDLDAVKQDMLEKEIDSFRRESYSVQFSELEKKFGIKTLRDFAEWKSFIEMSQRRNLMTHNDGKVNDQYLIVCDREGYKFDKRPAIGEELFLRPEYMTKALLVVSKVGFMLGHTLWRHQFPHDMEAADNAMNIEIYDLLTRRRWATASQFGEFGLSAPMLRNAKDMSVRIRVVNTAIALKRSKRAEEAVQLLDVQDWSASLRDFKLAIAVLKEDYASAARIMSDIGKEGELVSKVAYHIWPLFEDFRQSPDFLAAYEVVYDEPFMRKATEEAQAITEDLRKEVPVEAAQPLAASEDADSSPPGNTTVELAT